MSMFGKSPKELIRLSAKVMKTEGVGGVILKTGGYLKKCLSGQANAYGYYITHHEPGFNELEEQKIKSKEFAYRPKYSICIPLYQTKEAYLTQLLDSIRHQTYDNYEICLADASGSENHSKLEVSVENYNSAYPDVSIKYKKLGENKGIAENTNAAIEMAGGEIIVFADHDDTIAPNSLYEFTKALNEDSSIEVLYSDQDFLSENGKHRSRPLWKPEFSIDFLRCCNYMAHLLAVKKELLDRVGWLDASYDGSQDYDLILRLVENTKGIKRIPKMLYHWRTVSTSTALDPGTKNYAYENGIKALLAHYKRCNIPAEVEFTEHVGKYHTVYKWPQQPLVSIIIANKDKVNYLDDCILSIENLSEYRNFEIIIIENNSEEQITYDYYREIQTRFNNIRVLYYEDVFNYSKINNYGVSQAKGEYVLLLNNDTKMMDGKLIGEMLGILMREDVGAVGAKLFYKNNKLQHAGVIIGYGGLAGHAFSERIDEPWDYLDRYDSVVNYSAVTGACLMTKKSLYQQVGGMTEELAVAYNDVDYCLKLRKAGYLIVFTPHAKAWHFESITRLYDNEGENKIRFNKEAKILKSRWKEVLEETDPYYNPNLTVNRPDFSPKQDWEW